jgi:cellulose synthase operon protein C
MGVRALGAALVLAVTAPAAASSIAESFSDHVEAAVAHGLKPRDFQHLFLAFQWRDELPDLGLAEAAVDRLAGVRGSDPLMAAEVRSLRAHLAVEAGRPDVARELFRGLGGLTAWWVSGPVAVAELDDIEEARPPGAAAQWRSASGTDPLGWVRVAGLAWPARRQLVYLATTVVSDREQPVAVRVGAAQVARVWLNGEDLLTTPHPLQRAEDQHAASSWLRRGDNLLVVAVASESDDWWLRARVTAPDGSPLEGVREVEQAPRPTAAVGRRPATVRTLEEELRRDVTRGADGAAIALAAYLVARHPEPQGSGEAEVMCRTARGDAPGEARLLEWMLTTDATQAGRLLRDAVAAAPDLLPARIQLARSYARRGLVEEGLRSLADIGDPAARATRHELETILWGPIALPWLAQTSAAAPASMMAAAALGRAALNARRWDLARTALERLQAMAPAAQDTLVLRQRLAQACDDGAELRALLAASLDADPNQPEVRIRLARMMAAGGGDGALQVVQQGLDRCPDHVDLLLELATLEHARGEEDRTVHLAQRVLELRPQERRAQRLLSLLGHEAEDLAWVRSPRDLRELAGSAKESTPVTVLLDHTEVRFLPSQLTERRVQRAWLVRDADRASEFAAQQLPYVAERQRLRVLAARILRADGSEIAARQADTPRLADPEFNLYYDTRLRVLRFPKLEDGDLIEVSYVLSETAEANETGAYEGGIVRFGHHAPTLVAEVELSGPEHLLPAWELVNVEGTPVRSTQDGITHLRWSWRRVAAVPEDLPPSPPDLVMPYLVYSNHPDWGDLATWYERHVASRVRPSRQVEETAARLTEGVTDRLEKISRIYHFVTIEIRYVGLEFGEHRFRPFSADWVLSHRIGDCKDKAALLVALYDAAGIPARMVMVRTADQGVAPYHLAVLETFNHAIAYLPEDDLWLDGTAAGHATYPPPSLCQGAQVLVVDGPDSRPRITPTPGAGLATSHYTLRPGEQPGVVALTVRNEDTGEAADRRRSQLAGSHDPRRLAAWLQAQFPGADVTGEPVLRLVPGRDPTVVEIDGVVSRSALLGAGGIRTFPGAVELVGQVAPGDRRSGPLLLPVRPDLRWKLEVELGRAPASVPGDVDVSTRYGRLTIRYETSATGYRVDGFIHLEALRVEPAEVHALRDFLVGAERDLGRLLEVP